MKEVELDLTELIKEGKIDSISGRSFGEAYASKNQLMEEISNGNKIVLIISPDKIKAINDSFWKGFFSELFRKFKTKEKVQSFFSFRTDDYYSKSIDKNLTILDAIYKK